MTPDHGGAQAAGATPAAGAMASALPGPLVARTVAVDPADLPADLLDLLPAEGGLAWVRRGDGLVAWGEVGRVRATGPDRFTTAEQMSAAADMLIAEAQRRCRTT